MYRKPTIEKKATELTDDMMEEAPKKKRVSKKAAE